MDVLIVDDDHLVRKGIVSLMPWGDFGLRVAGEAENGKKALQFLETNPVQLLITDIAMPTMSGLELVREVRSKYPDIWIVVLTFYQDFEHVQEALRLGAIDYIAKIELEKNNMSEVLQRITGRIASSKANGERPASVNERPMAGEVSDKALMFIALGSDHNPDFLGELVSPARRQAVSEIDKGVWLLPELQSTEESSIPEAMFGRMHLNGKWAICRISDIRESNKQQLYKLLSNYTGRAFFYDYRPDQHVFDVSLVELSRSKLQLAEKDIYLLREHWSSLKLVYDQEQFRSLVAELEAIRPSAAKLESMFYWILIQWERYIPLKLTPLFEAAELRFWSDWLEWLEEIRKRIRVSYLETHYSDDMMKGIIRAVDYINDNLSLDLKLTEVAEEVHISRSYFSECFKNIIGKTFNEYLRDARIEFSKSLLYQTNDPIYKIAEKCGYPDEKYFSKVFRKQVGMLPSEIRKNQSSGDR